MWRNKVFSLINISGLAIGLACCILIFLFVNDELSYDKYHKNYKQIYRLGIDTKINEMQGKFPYTANPLAPTLLDEVPEVVHAVRIREADNTVIQNENRVFNEKRLFWADSTFFDVFTAKFIRGDPRKALASPRQMVITRTMANKYFGTVEVIGKILKVDNSHDYQISAVIEDCPHNSHFHYDFLIPYFDHWGSKDNNWLNDGKITYVMLQEGVSQVEFDKKLNGLVEKYAEPAFRKFMNLDLEELKKAGNYYKFYSRPIADIHLHSHSFIEIEQNGDIVNVYLFSIIAILILVIACINFTNLSTAKSTQRAKEIGIRKSLGSSKKRLIYQFLFESILLSIFAFAISLILVEILLPFTKNLTGKELSLNYLNNPYLFFLFLAIAIVTGLLAGAYSAFFLSSFNPVKVLKGDLTKGKNSFQLRKILVIFQFSISIFLFIATFVVHKQMSYIQKKDLGFKQENVLILEHAYRIKNQESFKQALKTYPGIRNVSFASHVPGELFNGNLIGRSPDIDPNRYNFRNISVDADFLNTMGIQIKKGRFFTQNMASDSASIIISETGVREMGLTEPIGEIITKGVRHPMTIIGVCKDFHSSSFKNRILPLIIKLEEEAPQKVLIHYHAINNQAVINTVQKEWQNYTVDTPFEYFHLDMQMQNIHKQEHATMRTFTAFAILSILIATLGLLGLSSYSTEQRTKEIGVRRTLGASILEIIGMMNKDFLRWILIALIIASPIAYFSMSKWLENFVYRTQLDVWIFIGAGLLSLFIATLTISWQSLKTARKNPVESLRYE